jgi:hypothetical protein
MTQKMNSATTVQVEWATVLGDVPKQHPGLVKEFCHSLTSDHTYFRQVTLFIQKLCDTLLVTFC